MIQFNVTCQRFNEDIGRQSQGWKPSEEVGRRENRDSFKGTELEQTRIAGHETVRAASDGTGEAVIVV